MRDLQEEKWVADARRGDTAAFESLLRRYEKRVLALTGRMCRNPEDAQEAAQEAQGAPQTAPEPIRRPDFIARREGLTAAQKGTALHLAMQYLPLEGDHSPEAIAPPVPLSTTRRSPWMYRTRLPPPRNRRSARSCASRSRQGSSPFRRSTGRCSSCGRSTSSAMRRSPSPWRWILAQ